MILILTYTIQILMLNFLTPFQSLAVMVPENSDRKFMGEKDKNNKILINKKKVKERL